MTILEMFGQSGILSLLGMGIVFSFLILLVIFVTATAKFVKLMKWDRDIWPVDASPVADQGSVPAEIAAAISSAVHEHQKRNS